MKRFKASVIGGSGYGAAEIIRRLLIHPHVELVRVASIDFVGEPLSAAHPNLEGLTELTFEKLTPEVHERMNALGDRTRARIDELGRRCSIPLHSTGLGHLIGIHWAEERVVDMRTRLLDDREKIVNINLALNNEGYYQTFTGLFLLSTAIGDQEIDGFLLALERSLHTLGYAK